MAPPTILGFKFLGKFSSSIQLLICTSGILIFFLIYGYTQEYIFSNKGFKNFGWYLTFIQFLLYALLAYLENVFTNSVQNHSSNINMIENRNSSSRLSDIETSTHYSEKSEENPVEISMASSLDFDRSLVKSPSKFDFSGNSSDIPYRHYSVLALLTVGTIGCSNTSLAFLNYPTQVIFKCCKLIPVMIGGILILKRKYGPLDFLAAGLMTTGLIFFTLANVNIAPSFNYKGIILITLALICDAIIGNVQEKLMKNLERPNNEIILYSYLFGSLYLFIGLLISNKFIQPFLFCYNNPSTYIGIFLFSFSGYIGLQFVLAIVRLFSAYLAITITTLRKAISIIISFLFFPNTFVMQYIWSGFIVTCGIILNTFAKSKSVEQQISIILKIIDPVFRISKFIVRKNYNLLGENVMEV